MKPSLLVLGVLVALSAAYISIVPNLRHRAEWKRTVVALQSLPHDRLDAAVQAFKRDQKTTYTTVPLRDLVLGGYLRAEDVRSLADRDVSVSLTADETRPQKIRIRVRAANGCDIVLLADGSVVRQPSR